MSKEGKSHSKLGSKATAPANNTPNHSGLQTPASLTDTQIESDIFSDDEPSAIGPQMLTEKLNNVLKSQNEKICGKFTIGKCPHGMSDRTVHNGTTCSLIATQKVAKNSCVLETRKNAVLFQNKM